MNDGTLQPDALPGTVTLEVTISPRACATACGESPAVLAATGGELTLALALVCVAVLAGIGLLIASRRASRTSEPR